MGEFYFKAGDVVTVTLRVPDAKPTSADQMSFALLENYDATTCEVAPEATVFEALKFNAPGTDFDAHLTPDHLHSKDVGGSAGSSDLFFDNPGGSVDYRVNFVHPGTYYLWLNVAA